MDEVRNRVWNEIRQLDLRAFAKQLTPEVFAEAAAASGVQIGCSGLNLVNLVWLGIATAIHHASSFTFVLKTTLELLEDQEGFYGTSVGKEKQKAQQRTRRKRKKEGKCGKKSKHHPHGDDPTLITEEAFSQARQRMPLAFWMSLLTVLAQRFQENHAQHLNFRSFRLLAIDGTTLTLPRAHRLHEHYGRPKNSARKKAAPQARMVLLTLPGVRIPIAYEVSPLRESELTLAGRLMSHVQTHDLLLMDRGFISYGLFWQIQHRGAYFGTRLKKNMKFKNLQRLGDKDWLVEWTPKDSRGRWKQLPRSMKLRVIQYRMKGFRPSAIVTNVLDPKRLPREDWVRVAQDCDKNGKLKPGLYHRRWEIETTFAELKVVLNMKFLRSHTPASLEYELAGRMVYYLLIRWLMVLAAEKHGLDPLRISFTGAVWHLQQMWDDIVTGSLDWVRRTLLPRLLDRIASHIVPPRPGRHYPRPNDTQAKDRGHGQKQAASKQSNRINSKGQNKQRKTRQQA